MRDSGKNYIEKEDAIKRDTAVMDISRNRY
jgi:hypothetical protein